MNWKDELLERNISEDNIKEVYELTRKRTNKMVKTAWDSIIENISDMDPRIRPVLKEHPVMSNTGIVRVRVNSHPELHLVSETKTIVYYPNELTIKGYNHPVIYPSARLDPYTNVFRYSHFDVWTLQYASSFDGITLTADGHTLIWEDRDTDSLLHKFYLSLPIIVIPDPPKPPETKFFRMGGWFR